VLPWLLDDAGDEVGVSPGAGHQGAARVGDIQARHAVYAGHAEAVGTGAAGLVVALLVVVTMLRSRPALAFRLVAA
jgi:hypothetical protein